MAAEKGKFNLRSFTSFTLVISTLIMSWSGFILYVAPPGRIANWGTWKLMLFTKSEWQALHTIFSYLFFILVIIHLFFVNWKTFLTYFKSKLKSGLNKKWELGTAIILSSIFFIGTLRHWTPFEPVMTFGEKVKEGWEGDFQTPPVLHMETYTLEQLSVVLDSIAPAKLLKTLQDSSIKVTGTKETLKEIANNNNTTPSAIYNILAAKNKQHTGPVAGEVPQGIGKYTVNSTAVSSGIEVTSLILKLKEKGIEAEGETTLRTIADKLGVTPRDVYTMLTSK
ncbi:MAG: DUF4405 domain-containing protein [Bacteroidales bacterium]|nr:DUF4405 domain-containing protein [Bacteroidales bacterium]